ncbi:4Fe-4S single cluster domain-containing protein [Kutzneria sp. NPDC051319]|uniref:4Fe-4S single cluster domain-containing protein n=1 Tax=Kutzneria sp. NPDC051319 TaxID=3155047 RepID=UPI003447DA43
MSGETLRVARALYPVTALGPGRRLGIWTQGCPLACKGCMSRDTWDPAGGEALTVEDLVELCRDAMAQGADGLTVSGGEPLQQPEPLGALLAGVDEARKAANRDFDVMVYTGYTEAELDDARLRAVAHCDVLVVGRFDVSRPTSLIWRGSANQRLLPLSELGRRRYADYVDHTPERPPMQLLAEGERFRVIGVPRAGSLGEFERGLRDRGFRIVDTTWRP